MVGQLPYYDGATKQAIKRYVQEYQSSAGSVESEPAVSPPKEKAISQYPTTPKNFLIPKSLKGQQIEEVPPEMINLKTGENLISFGRGG